MDAQPSNTSPTLRATLIRVLRSTTVLPAQFTLYASAIGAVLLVAQSNPEAMPGALAGFVSALGVNAFSDMLSRAAHSPTEAADLHATIRQAVI